MSNRRLHLVICVSFPAVLVGAIGLLHPHHLTEGSAGLWQAMHILLIPIFPLIGFAPWLIARRVDRRLGIVAAVGGYGFATFYTALDLIAGVAAGTVQLAGVPEAKAPLYEIARVFGIIGVCSLVIACLAASVAVVVLRRLRALPGALLAVVGAVLVQPGHIYPGMGTLAMAFLAVGFGLLAWAATRQRGASSDTRIAQKRGEADSGPAPSPTTTQ